MGRKKYVRFGPHRIPIGSPLIAQGYQAGMQACLARVEHDECEDSDMFYMLDDREFTTVLDQYMPAHLSAEDASVWRAYFIVGWTWIYLDGRP